MKDEIKGSGDDRRGFLCKAAGCIAGATLVAIAPISEGHAADVKPCSAEEVEQLKTKLHDRQFADAAGAAWYVKKLQEKFGPGVLEVVKQTTIENARRQTEKSPVPKEKRNLAAVKAWYAEFGGDVTYTWVEDGPERLKAKVTKCRWAEEMKKAGVDGEVGFSVVCCYDYGYVAAFNPDMKFTRTKTLMQGHDCCDHTYELKA